MSTQVQRMIARYGNPQTDRIAFERNWMRTFTYPTDVREKLPTLGLRVYCNREFWPRYLAWLRIVIARGLGAEIRTDDECFNVRAQRGNPALLSMHAFGCAVDLNTADNPRGTTRAQGRAHGLHPFSDAFIQSIRDAGLTAGNDFTVPDPMHLEGTV